MQYKMLNNKRIFSRVVPSASGCRMVGPLTHILTRIWAQGCPKLTCTLALPAADDQPWRRTRAQQRRPCPRRSPAQVTRLLNRDSGSRRAAGTAPARALAGPARAAAWLDLCGGATRIRVGPGGVRWRRRLLDRLRSREASSA